MELEQAFQHLYKTYFGELQHEKEEIENLPNILTGCDIFIDVGASLGMFTYFANKELKNASIISVEADPDRYLELKKNCDKWEKEGTNTITAVNRVLGESEKRVTFYKTGTNISGGLFPVEERSDEYKPIEIQQTILDEFYEPEKQIVVKIDVEGAEYRVLQGALEHLKNKNTKFLIEMHWWGDREKGTTSLDVLKFLYSQKMSIKKTVRVHTSNYLFQSSKKDEWIFPLYIKYLPLLLGKVIYGRYIPKTVRNFRENLLNKRRKKRFGSKL